jgi:hypothetical protein
VLCQGGLLGDLLQLSCSDSRVGIWYGGRLTTYQARLVSVEHKRMGGLLCCYRGSGICVTLRVEGASKMLGGTAVMAHATVTACVKLKLVSGQTVSCCPSLRLLRTRLLERVGFARCAVHPLPIDALLLAKPRRDSR